MAFVDKTAETDLRFHATYFGSTIFLTGLERYARTTPHLLVSLRRCVFNDAVILPGIILHHSHVLMCKSFFDHLNLSIVKHDVESYIYERSYST